MFRSPLTLQDIFRLRDFKDKVPLGEMSAFEDGLLLLADGEFTGYEILDLKKDTLQAQFFVSDEKGQGSSLRVFEHSPEGALEFECIHCKTSTTTEHTCAHQWAGYVILWQALATQVQDQLEGPVARLSQELKEFSRNRNMQQSDRTQSFADCKLESVSLYFDERPMLRGLELSKILTDDFEKYHFQQVTKEKELLSPSLWNMPEIFRRKITAYSGFYLNEVQEQNRLTAIVRYNFSNGDQISAQEILRHPLHKVVSRDLLPQPKKSEQSLNHWPLTQQREHLFVSQNLKEVEEIMQGLLHSIVTKFRQGGLKIYLQSHGTPGQALQLSSIDFDTAAVLHWRVDFTEKNNLETEFKLMSSYKNPLNFYESFAVDPKDRVVIVHPWLREWSLLQEVTYQATEKIEDWIIPQGEMPAVHTTGELEAKVVLKHLRTRIIPVRVTGETKKLAPQQSLIEVCLEENGSFHVQHKARIMGQKDLIRRGWTPRASLYLHTLSEGLPYLLSVQPGEIAARARGKRDWDLKLLKHLGVLQYLTMEILFYYFEGNLSDGRIVEEDEIFTLLHDKVKALLFAGSGEILARDLTLVDLCSKSVLNHFEDFVRSTLKMLKCSESFFSEHGEVILEGVVEREFRLIFEILKQMALTSSGEAFKKSRTSFLSKIWTGDPEKDPYLASGIFHLPKSKKEGSQIHEALEVLQALIPHGFSLLFKGQPLQELGDDDFKVDFLLQSDTTQGELNWFELNPKFFLMGQEVDPKEMSHFGSGGVIEYDGRLYLVPRKQMPSLRRLENFWLKLQRGKSESGQKQGQQKIYQLPRHQILELLALRSSGYGIRGDEEWKKICEFYDGLGKTDRELKMPSSMTATLKPYQVTGVQWLQDLYRLRLGALLADDMGLGKTLQALTFLEDLREKEQLGQVLIVVPSSLIFNWQSEVEKFTPKLPLTVFSNKDRDIVGKKLESKQPLVVITTYGLLMEHEDFLNQYKWKVLIFDEAQNLKNISTKRTSSARSLTAQFKICLTGTPMENHYGEFYSLVDLLVPGSLGKVEDFRRKFVQTEMVTREEIEDLKLKIKPLLLRRTKKEILDQLPDKQETKVSIAFEEKQKEIYRDIALSYNEQVQDSIRNQGEASVQLKMLTALLRLRQACSDPAALPNVRYDKVPPKLEALMDSLQEIVESGESALVFTQFIQTLEHTSEILKKAGIPVFVLHGGVPTKQRQKILQDFNQVQGGAVLVMTLKTGGVGLNLTKASYVFHLEPWWNPSVENQATDRAHRLGQSKAVQVFRYIMHESLEEKIELLKVRKDQKFQSLFATPESESEIGPGSGALSKEDFDLLIGIKK